MIPINKRRHLAIAPTTTQVSISSKLLFFASLLLPPSPIRHYRKYVLVGRASIPCVNLIPEYGHGVGRRPVGKKRHAAVLAHALQAVGLGMGVDGEGAALEGWGGAGWSGGGWEDGYGEEGEDEGEEVHSWLVGRLVDWSFFSVGG
jgi:hypothetical protein